MSTEAQASRCGPLALFGGEGLREELTPAWQRLRNHLPGTAPQAAIVPTALAEHKMGMAERRGTLTAAALNKMGLEARVVPVLTRTEADSPDVAAALAAAHVIVLTGGDTRALVKVLGDSAAWVAIQQAHHQGATLVAGGGAAVALGEKAFAPQQPVPPELDRLAFECFNGMGLLPWTVILPYADWVQPTVLSQIASTCTPEARLVALDGAAVLIADSSGWNVEGSGGVTIWEQGGRRHSIPAGMRVPDGLLPPYPTR